MNENPRSIVRYAFFVLLVAVSVGVYLGTLDNDFISDDKFQIAENFWIKDFSNLGRILFSSVWDFSSEGGDSNYYRPVKYVLYTVAYSLSGIEPWGYHLIKIVLHTVNAVLCFLLAMALFSGKLGEGKEKGPEPFFVAASAALIFALHPVNTEAVSWIAALPEVSFTLFVMLMLLSYMRGRVLLAAVWFFVAMLSKETALLSPLMLVGYDLVIKRERVTPIAPHIRRYIPFVIAVVVHLVMRYYALDGDLFSLGGGGEEAKTEKFLSTALYAFNAPLLFWTYLSKLVLPVGLSFFTYMNFEPARSVFDARGLLSIAVFVGVLLFLLWSIKRERRVLFLLIWIGVGLLPVYALGLGGGVPLYESRYIYYAVPAYSIILAWLIFRFFSFLPGTALRRTGPLIVVLLISVAFSAGTVVRNGVWQSEFTLWRDTARKNPENPPARVSYGVELAKMDRLEEALIELKEGVRLNPRGTGAHNNIGIVYAKLGNFERAAYEFQLAVQYDPTNLEAKKNLAQALEILKSAGGGGVR